MSSTEDDVKQSEALSAHARGLVLRPGAQARDEERVLMSVQEYTSLVARVDRL